MGYVEDSLVRGEQIVLKARISSMIIFWPLIVFVVFGIIVWILFKEMLTFRGVMTLVLIVYGIITMINSVVTYLTTEFALTSWRIIAKTGLIKRHSLEMMLGKVESINVQQNLMGRIFNLGTITIIGSGGTHQSFRAIEKPMDLRSQVNQAIASY